MDLVMWMKFSKKTINQITLWPERRAGPHLEAFSSKAYHHIPSTLCQETFHMVNLGAS